MVVGFIPSACESYRRVLELTYTVGVDATDASSVVFGFGPTPTAIT